MAYKNKLCSPTTGRNTWILFSVKDKSALETYNMLSFLWSVVCKWPVTNVALLTLKIATKKWKTKWIFSNNSNGMICALNV